MQCPKCNNEVANDSNFCSKCGYKFELKSCQNKSCFAYNEKILPAEAKFCSVCGETIPDNENVPFHIRYPQYNLVPFCEFDNKDRIYLGWFKKDPEYIEDIYVRVGINYLWMVRNEKIGVCYLLCEDHWYGKTYDSGIVIPYEYDKIEDKGNYYICYKGEEKRMFSRDGKELK